MWLLDTTSLELKFVHDCKDVEYAILSHTWEGEEVTFQELKAGSAKEKQGYQKIVKTCSRALADGLQYAWVDTCCINKESSVELSEAINSMWQWYSCAFICYVYMCDVDGRCPRLTDKRRENRHDFGDTEERHFDERYNVWHNAFRSSRWFTRGWTLQELLAPERIDFYGRDWNFIGWKNSLIETISDVTSIDELALENRDYVPSFVIARIMSWAAGRETTRVEDRAYSLLGLFNINMPLLYGEGEKAFARLLEELMQKSTDLSVFAWQRQYEEFSYEDMLFAKSPDDFKIGKRIISFSDVPHSQYRLTNRGIEFNTILFAESKFGCFVVLNCRFEDNFSGPIALRLRQNAWPSSSSDNEEMAKRGEFWIGPSRNDLEMPRDTVVQTWRLTTYGGFDTIKEYERTVTVLRHVRMPSYQTVAFWFVPTKIWVKKTTSSSEDFEIVAADPLKAWNLTTGVMCPPNHRRSAGIIVGGVTLRFQSSKTTISVAFQAPLKLSHRDLNKGIFENFKIVMHRSSNYGQARRDLSTVGHSRGAEVTDEHGNSYSAFVELSRIMGDDVWVIGVSKDRIPPCEL